VTVRRTDITQEEYFRRKELQSKVYFNTKKKASSLILFLDENQQVNKRKRITGEIVSPSTPRLESGKNICVFLLKFIFIFSRFLLGLSSKKS
jgi:hypothetical protein